MDYANNVTRLLDSRRIPYRVRLYTYGEGLHSATEVADAIGAPPERVFKTLVALPETPGRKPLLAVIPGPTTLDLKRLAKAAGVKKAKMASHEDAEKMTGLLTGGISALALTNKGFDVLLDAGALRHDTIVVSAGVRGAQIELAPSDFIRLTRARTVELTG
jgi:Cys-tRNA(Pro)/Cys-tRNA(Cys) deacylase